MKVRRDGTDFGSEEKQVRNPRKAEYSLIRNIQKKGGTVIGTKGVKNNIFIRQFQC
ncbi:MAG: hypothetical protein HUU08_06295 [Candidatus Brocadia sp.]|nr:hypothetical protein [Candidatus Brocadia sp.]